jgi:hypothetical protein
MFAPKRAGVNLDKFLSKLKITLTKCGGAIAVASQASPPQWATSYTHLLYTDKSIPPDFNEPGKLYISFKTEHPGTVKLVGKTKDQKPINRMLNISQPNRNLVTIISEHKDFRTGRVVTWKGVGKTFQSALDHYFASSDLKKPDYTYNTDGNVQHKGDAFLLPRTITSKGDEGWVSEIVNTVRKLINLIPEDKHDEVLTTIEKNIQGFDKFIKSSENDKVIIQYDARLWLIVEAVCKHFDPINEADDPKRKGLRDYFIAECCSKLMREEDIIPGIKNYFEAMKMHHDIVKTAKEEVLSEYKTHKLYPEIAEHRERIKEYHGKCNAETEEEKNTPSR